MLLTDFRKTSGFRLALSFLGIFGVAAFVMVGLIYWQTATYLTSGSDRELKREALGLQPHSDQIISSRLEEHARNDPGDRRPFGLFDLAGHPLAGNLRKLPAVRIPRDKPFEFVETVRGRPVTYRGLALRLANGGLIVVSQDVDDLEDFTVALGKALIACALVTIILGLLGAIVIGAGAARRLRAITLSIEQIVAGDLTRRLPDAGTSSDIDRLVRVVNGMLQEIEWLLGEVKGVCDSIAHDMRTPLTRLLAGLERARRPSTAPEDVVPAIDRGIEQTREILQTFNALLRISEVEAGARSAAFHNVDLVQIAQDLVEYHEPLAETKGIDLILTGAEHQPLQLFGDADLLFEAIGNLVDNALKFAPAGGRVEVKLGPGPVIAVKDDGPGIRPEERELVLLRFHRSEQSRSQPGNGLGLALVAAIARIHRLELAINGEAGCVVTLSRPLP